MQGRVPGEAGGQAGVVGGGRHEAGRRAAAAAAAGAPAAAAQGAAGRQARRAAAAGPGTRLGLLCALLHALMQLKRAEAAMHAERLLARRGGKAASLQP